MDPARVKGVPNCSLMSNKNILTDWDEATDRDHHNKAQGLRSRYEHTKKDQLAFPRVNVITMFNAGTLCFLSIFRPWDTPLT